MKINIPLTLAVFFLLPFSVSAFDHKHTTFTSLLEKHVIMTKNGQESRVNYSALKKDYETLKKYLSSLSSVTQREFHSWPEEKRLSFLINTYNAFTIDLILKHYPVTSIQKTGSLMRNPWKIKFINLYGKTISLDDLEHGLVRQKGVYDEPRIHFALVCASIGCPALQNKAFTYDQLEVMLEKGLVNFLSDKTRNRYNSEKKSFEVSKIFKWFGGDFEKKYGSVINLLNTHSKYLVKDEKALPSAEETNNIKFLNYDWNLNDIKK